MEKNTILAVVLSIVVIVGFYVIQGIFFPIQQPAASVSVERTDGAAGGGSSGVSPVSPGAVQPSGEAHDGEELGGARRELGVDEVAEDV
ncbi:MAG: hypothetical protein LBF60_03950, partial [Treponema sp.]|nr:hypothetical protein [Treponema sp.]